MGGSLTRKILFWVHLSVGVSAGLVVLSMSVTGMMLAFEPQIAACAERSVQPVISPSPDTVRLILAVILDEIREARPAAKPTTFTLKSDPEASAAIGFGREGTLYINPYTGQVLGSGSKINSFFQSV